MADSGVYLMDNDDFLAFIDAMAEHYNNVDGDDSVE